MLNSLPPPAGSWNRSTDEPSPKRRRISHAAHTRSPEPSEDVSLDQPSSFQPTSTPRPADVSSRLSSAIRAPSVSSIGINTLPPQDARPLMLSPLFEFPAQSFGCGGISSSRIETVSIPVSDETEDSLRNLLSHLRMAAPDPSHSEPHPPYYDTLLAGLLRTSSIGFKYCEKSRKRALAMYRSLAPSLVLHIFSFADEVAYRSPDGTGTPYRAFRVTERATVYSEFLRRSMSSAREFCRCLYGVFVRDGHRSSPMLLFPNILLSGAHSRRIVGRLLPTRLTKVSFHHINLINLLELERPASSRFRVPPSTSSSSSPRMFISDIFPPFLRSIHFNDAIMSQRSFFLILESLSSTLEHLTLHRISHCLSLPECELMAQRLRKLELGSLAFDSVYCIHVLLLSRTLELFSMERIRVENPDDLVAVAHMQRRNMNAMGNIPGIDQLQMRSKIDMSDLCVELDDDSVIDDIEFFRKYSSSTPLKRRSNRVNTIRYLRLATTHFSLLDFRAVLYVSPHLVHLSLIRCEVESNCIEDILESCPVLDSLSVELMFLCRRGHRLGKRAIRNASITALYITDSGPVTPIHLVRAIGNFPRLVKLQMEKCRLTHDHIAVLADTPIVERLTFLNLDENELPKESFSLIGRRFPKLEFLDYGGNEVFDDQLPEFFAFLPKLEYLGLCFIPTVTDAGIKALPWNLKSLLVQQTCVTDVGLEWVKQFSNVDFMVYGRNEVNRWTRGEMSRFPGN